MIFQVLRQHRQSGDYVNITGWDADYKQGELLIVCDLFLEAVDGLERWLSG